MSECNSTPHSKGGARTAEYNKDYRAKTRENIKNVEEDLKKTEVMPTMTFLKTVLARLIYYVRGGDPYDDEIVKDTENVFREMLSDAVAFCNDKTNQNRIQLWDALETYSQQRLEKDRYLPISKALNTILREFRDKAYGDIPIPAQRADDEEVIFMPNDPVTIESKHLKDPSIPPAERKPDVIGVLLPFLREVYDDCQDHNFADMATKISRLDEEKEKLKQTKKKVEEKVKPTWCDVQQTWELKNKYTRKAMPFPGDNDTWNVQDILNRVQTNKPLEQKPVTAPEPEDKQDKKPSAKRGRDVDDDENSRTKKKSCGESSTALKVFGKDPNKKTEDDEPINLSNDVQCAFYAIERLRGSWSVSHSILMLLSDSKLSIRWFDPQGCLESEEFDILLEPPLLVLQAMIFQRYDPYMLGLTQRDATKVVLNGETYYLEPAEPRFQLHGRHSYTTSADIKPNTPDIEVRPWDLRSGGQTEAITPPKTFSVLPEVPTTERPSENTEAQDKHIPPPPKGYFFKSSWAECERDKEPDVLREARRRAEKHLPENCIKMVTNHIPDVVASKECTSKSTAIIRILAKRLGGLPNLSYEDLKRQARVQILMVTRRLFNMTDIRDSPTEWKVFWEINRCVYLLWRIGIAHGDVSLSNMMASYLGDGNEVIGILNDFDLAAIMKVGDRNPTRKGWERTGTIPFMALELLEYYDGQLKRWYRHDLESAAWCFAYHILQDRMDKWFKNSIENIFDAKLSFDRQMGKLRVLPRWDSYREFANEWVQKWASLYTSRTKAITRVPIEQDKVKVLEAEDDKTEESFHIDLAVQDAKREKDSPGLEVFETASIWIHVTLIRL